MVTIASYVGSQLLAVCGLLLVMLVIFIAGGDQNAFTRTNTAQFISVILSAVTLTGLVYGYVRFRHISVGSLGINRLKWKYAGYAFIGFGVYFLLYIFVLGMLSSLAPGINVNQEQELGFSTSVSGLQLIPIFLSLVVLPPLVEEFVMRGFLFSRLRTQIRFGYSAIIVSLVFGAAHLPSGKVGLLWIGALDTFLLSLVLCYLREKTGSLWPSIGLHGLKNGLAFLLVFVFPNIIR